MTKERDFIKAEKSEDIKRRDKLKTKIVNMVRKNMFGSELTAIVGEYNSICSYLTKLESKKQTA